jgi:hypothetical protein
MSCKFFFSRADVRPPPSSSFTPPLPLAMSKVTAVVDGSWSPCTYGSGGAASQLEHGWPPRTWGSGRAANHLDEPSFHVGHNYGHNYGDAFPQILGNEFACVPVQVDQQYLCANAPFQAPQLWIPSTTGAPQINPSDFGQLISMVNFNASLATDALPIYATAGHNDQDGLPPINNQALSNSIAVPASTSSNAIPIATNARCRTARRVQQNTTIRQKCLHCGKSFGRISDLERHLKSHDPADWRKCAFCASLKRTSRPDKYKEHLIKSHRMEGNTAAKLAHQWV